MVLSHRGVTNSTLAKMTHYHRKAEVMAIIRAKTNPSLREVTALSTSEQLCLESVCLITAFASFDDEGSHDRH